MTRPPKSRPFQTLPHFSPINSIICFSKINEGRKHTSLRHGLNLPQEHQSQYVVPLPFLNLPCSSASSCFSSTICDILCCTILHITLYTTDPSAIPLKSSTSQVPFLFFLGTGTITFFLPCFVPHFSYKHTHQIPGSCRQCCSQKHRHCFGLFGHLLCVCVCVCVHKVSASFD